MGDQIVAINNTQVPTIDTKSHTINNNNTSDEVLLRLVQRLASLQQQRQQLNPQTELNFEHSKELENSYLIQDENEKNKESIELNNNSQEKLLLSHDEVDRGILVNKQSNEEDKTKLDENTEKLLEDIINCNMGSNVSRNSGNGLSGRRSQSSGNLCNGKHPPTNGAIKNQQKEKGRGNSNVGYNVMMDNSLAPHQTHNQKNDGKSTGAGGESCSIITPLCVVRKKDRNKFCGSLPNNLDSDDVCDFQHNQNLYSYGDNNNTLEGVEYVTVAPRKNHQQQNHEQIQNSPYNNSSSGKGSITSSTNLGSSTFKTNHEHRPEFQLKLPLNRVNFDAGCDQGYGSERSPEDEIPPVLPLLRDVQFAGPNIQILANTIQQHDWSFEKDYDFITKDCTFAVQISKGPRGLGLSVSGGSDTNSAFPGLIRIKRLFPHQAAWATNMLQPGDILLEANGVPLTDLTNYEALEVLRTTPNNVTLVVCRPHDEIYRKLSPPTEPPKPPQRTSLQNNAPPLNLTYTCSYPLEPLSSIQTNYSGEFEIIMTKQQGSLGFTLRKEDDSVLGHYVRALVRDPALNDSRIRPGDKIVAVNDVPMSPMSHEEAVIFLRQSADEVKLRLYRDDAQTPVAALSPTNPDNKDFCGTLQRQKANLRPEAINLLSDLAYRKQTPDGDSTGSSHKSNANTSTTPRRLKRGLKNQSSSASRSETDSQGYIVSNQTASCSDSDTSTISHCSFVVQPSMDDRGVARNHDCYREDELFEMVDDTSSFYEEERPDRPNFLDLIGQSGSTPVVSRKPRFQFTIAANAYELNNLDNEALDAPIYTGKIINPNENSSTSQDINQDFTSLPCETFLVACMTESDLNNSIAEQNFIHRNPMYQSVHVPYNNNIKDSLPEEVKKDGTKSLLKWKGVTFSAEDENETPEADSSCGATIGTNPTPGTDRDLDFNGFTTDNDGNKVLIVELNRGWNSRLGFSLQTDPNTNQTVISAIYDDSVAARDGRLMVGDQVIMVNDEPVDKMTTAEIIELLRIIRGSICVVVIRKI